MWTLTLTQRRPARRAWLGSIGFRVMPRASALASSVSSQAICLLLVITRSFLTDRLWSQARLVKQTLMPTAPQHVSHAALIRSARWARLTVSPAPLVYLTMMAWLLLRAWHVSLDSSGSRGRTRPASARTAQLAQRTRINPQRRRAQRAPPARTPPWAPPPASAVTHLGSSTMILIPLRLAPTPISAGSLAVPVNGTMTATPPPRV